MTSSFEDVYRIQTARIMELERELTAAKKEIEELRILLGGIQETYATELSPQCIAAIDAAIEKERGEK